MQASCQGISVKRSLAFANTLETLSAMCIMIEFHAKPKSSPVTIIVPSYLHLLQRVRGCVNADSGVPVSRGGIPLRLMLFSP